MAGRSGSVDTLTAHTPQASLTVTFGGAGAAASARADAVKDLRDRPVAPGEGGSLPYRAFAGRHVEYIPEVWARNRALYRGGHDLLNPATIRTVLVRNNAERNDNYDWRCSQAFYINWCSEIIDHVVAGMGDDALRILMDDQEVAEDDPLAIWARDVSPASATRREDINAFARDMVLEAMQVRRAWVMLELPEIPAGEEPPATLLEAEERGLNRLCMRIVPAEEVVHWQHNRITKQLEWVMVRTIECEFADFYSPPLIRETFTRYRATTYSQWMIEYQEGKEPQPEALVSMVVDEEDHGFERMPVREFKLPPGLWAMEKLESPARAAFNKWNTLDVAERRALLPILYEFLGAESSQRAAKVSLSQTNPNRALATPRSQTTVQVRGADDDAKYVGPPAEPFKHALASLEKIRDEMHRVLYQMALASDPQSAAAIGRSGESKAQDRAATAVILKSLGVIVRDFFQSLIVDVCTIANVADPDDYYVDGMAKFDDVGNADVVEQTLNLSAMGIPSPTAQQEIFMRLLRRVLDHLSEARLAKIQSELESNITTESIAPDPEPTAVDEGVHAGIKDAVHQHVSETLGVSNDQADEGDSEDETKEEAPAPRRKRTAADGPLVSRSRSGRRK